MAIILFDIDGTLFDPKKFGSLYRGEMARALSIGEEDLYAAIADYYSTLEQTTDLDPSDLIDYLAKRFNVEQDMLSQIFWKPSNFKESKFEDAEPALRSLSSENSLGVFSEGIRKYQEYKLEHTGLVKYFNPELIFVYRRKVAEDAMGAIPQDTTVVEDRHDVAVSLAKNKKTIWLNRLNMENDPQIKTIHSLSELVG